MMVVIKTNIGEVTAELQSKLAALADKENIPRILSFDTIDLMTKRIHVDGKDSDDAQIGTYSKGYMAVRTGVFKSNEVFKSGKNKGKKKPTGVFTKGDSKGLPRPNYKRSGETKVIISLTRQLENDWSVIATDKGYGVGFLNPHNLDKARWTEATYKKKIFSLSPSEESKISERVQQLVSDGLK